MYFDKLTKEYARSLFWNGKSTPPKFNFFQNRLVFLNLLLDLNFILSKSITIDQNYKFKFHKRSCSSFNTNSSYELVFCSMLRHLTNINLFHLPRVCQFVSSLTEWIFIRPKCNKIYEIKIWIPFVTHETFCCQSRYRLVVWQSIKDIRRSCGWMFLQGEQTNVVV